MVFRPPPPAPFAGPSNPPRVSATVDASPNWWQNNSQNAGAAAGAVVDSYGGEIRQFVAQQRLNYAAGIVPINRQPMSPGPDLDVFYMNQQGQENIHYLVRPESSVDGRPRDAAAAADSADSAHRGRAAARTHHNRGRVL